MDNKYAKRSVPLILCDTTLRDGLRTPCFNPTLKEKESLFSALEMANIDIIEVGYCINGTYDLELLETITPTNLSSSISILCHANERDIKRAYEAVKHLKRPRLHLFLSVGEIELPYQDSLETDYLSSCALEMVALASSLCDDVQLTLMDATRCELEKLIKISKSAIKYGLGTLTLADTTGCATPMSMSQLINGLSAKIDMEFVHLGVHCHNDNNLANEMALMAHQCGVSHLEGTIGGIGERFGNVNICDIMRKHHKDVDKIQAYETTYQLLMKEHHADTRDIAY